MNHPAGFPALTRYHQVAPSLGNGLQVLDVPEISPPGYGLEKLEFELERETPPEAEADRGRAALTALFEETRNGETPVMVKRIVDDIVRQVRFDGWQNTLASEREVKMALRRTLFKYKLHQDTDLSDRAYGYIRQYY